MLSKFSFALIGVPVVMFAAVSQAAAGGTTRIETRPFYGAVVTLEEGVRVFRPLPADDHVIINPGGKTPVNLSFNETNVYERRIVKHYHYGEGGSSPVFYGRGGGFPFVPGIGRHNHGGNFHGGPHHRGVGGVPAVR